MLKDRPAIRWLCRPAAVERLESWACAVILNNRGDGLARSDDFRLISPSCRTDRGRCSTDAWRAVRAGRLPGCSETRTGVARIPRKAQDESATVLDRRNRHGGYRRHDDRTAVVPRFPCRLRVLRALLGASQD